MYGKPTTLYAYDASGSFYNIASKEFHTNTTEKHPSPAPWESYSYSVHSSKRAKFGAFSGEESRLVGLPEVSRDEYALLKQAKRVAAPGERVHICGTVQPKGKTRGNVRGGDVEVRFDGRKASFRGLFRCNQIHSCPHCARKASAERSRVLVEAMRNHLRTGGRCYLVTLTFRHSYGDKLKTIDSALRRAYRRFHSGRTWQTLSSGVVGTVTSREVTYGGNGFHPHLHAIVFTSRTIDEPEIEMWRNHWLHVLALEGLDGTQGAAFVMHETTPTGYATKWGGERELLGEHQKGSKHVLSGFNQWELLARSNTPRYRALWLEYVAAFSGTHKLQWSRGLKELLGVRGIEFEEPATVKLGTLTASEFRTLTTGNHEQEFLRDVVAFGWSSAYAAFFRTSPIPLILRSGAVPGDFS